MSWHALPTAESVYVPKVLTRTQCTEDHAELLARGREGGRRSRREKRWEKGRWGARKEVEAGELIHTKATTQKFLLLQTYRVDVVELDFTVAAFQCVV